MAAEFYRRLVLLRTGRLIGGLFRGRGAGLQSLHPAPHGRKGSPEMRLELLELLERVRLGLANDLVGLALRVAHDLRGMALGATQDLVLGNGFLGALVRARHDAGRLGVGLVTSTPFRPFSDSSISLTRSSTVKSGCRFSGLAATATITRSKMPSARSTTSRWPFVKGSKLPG